MSDEGQASMISEEISTGIEKIVGTSEEQHTFIGLMKLLHEQLYTSTNSTIEAIIELLLSEVLLYPSCIKSALLYTNLYYIILRVTLWTTEDRD